MARFIDERTWVVAYGSSEQLERFDAGVLPPEELAALIEPHLFAPLNGFERYTLLEDADVDHEPNCRRPDIRFRTRPHASALISGLDADEWQRVKSMRAAVAGRDNRVEVREHQALCRGCDPKVRLVRLSVRVTVVGSYSKYRREYAL
jgi:hypothetical protein